MTSIVVVGAGGMAREVAALLRALNRKSPQFEFHGYVVTDLASLGERDSRDEVLGDYNWLAAHRDEIDAVAIGIGTPATRVKVAADVRRVLPHAAWPYLIHPSAELDLDTAKIGEGAFIGARVVGTVNLVLEPFALCNFGCTLGHEARIGRGSVINPGANISGGVSIGDEVLVGTGAQVLQYRSVGSGATVGAGAVVTKDVPPGVTVVGVPARALTRAGSASDDDSHSGNREPLFPLQ